MPKPLLLAYKRLFISFLHLKHYWVAFFAVLLFFLSFPAPRKTPPAHARAAHTRARARTHTHTHTHTRAHERLHTQTHHRRPLARTHAHTHKRTC